VLLNVLASELQRFGTTRASAPTSSRGQRHVPPDPGWLPVIAMILGHGVIGFRDPHGIRLSSSASATRRAAVST